MKIIPGPLTSDINELKIFINEAQSVIDRLQIDIVDGVFANNKTVTPQDLNGIETSLAFDYHLMVEDPVSWVDRISQKEGNRLIGQIEMMDSQSEFVTKVKEKSYLVGLGVDLDTPVDKLDQQLFDKLDVILLMSVQAGFGGQEFDLAVWDKIGVIEKIRREMDFKFKICVDGGVTRELINDMAKGGVDEIVIGKRIFEGGLQKNLESFSS